ncbi:hypothetical protein EON66_11145 [archaeon]|nr:MAG: hypothetical protein EON66_11145 [archaeon]
MAHEWLCIACGVYVCAGSGKTFSMMGDDEYPGIIPQLNRDLFSYVLPRAS